MNIKEEVTIMMKPNEVEKILKEHFSDDYDIDAVFFRVEVVYNDFGDYPSNEMTEVKLVGKKKGSSDLSL